jgi:hypothetical protein
MAHDYTDPILLTAVCTFAYDLYESEEINGDKEMMEPYANEMKALAELVPYMGFEKYPKLLEMTRKYHNMSYQSNKPIKFTEAGSREEEQMTHIQND